MNRADLKIKSVFRLGRFSEDKHKEGKSRPIKLVLYKSDDRDSIMRNAYLLGEGECSDPELRGIHLGYDLSEQERNDIKVKIDEAKELSSNSNKYFWKVRGPPWNLWLKKVEKR